MGRKSVLKVLVAVAVLLAAAATEAEEVGPGYDIEMSRMIPMRDGVELEAWIFKPSHLKAKAPGVLTLTQYDIDGGRRNVAAYTRRGYVFVQVYVRGRGRSGGVKSDNLGLQVGRDGYDVVEWIAAQPWSDGHVVMFGGSFVGMTQWRAAAQHPPHLAAIAPYVPIYPGWDVPQHQRNSAGLVGGDHGLHIGPLAECGVHCKPKLLGGKDARTVRCLWSLPGTGRCHRDCSGRLVDD